MSAKAPYTGGVKVIGTGLGRTGTSSLKKALEILYDEVPCYHMVEVIGKGGPLGHFDFWVRVDKGEVTAEELRAHLAPYASTCDYPSCTYWKEQLAAYPDAKLVHSTRSPESWATSAMDTIFSFNPNNPAQPWGVWLLQRLFPFKVGRPMERMLRAVLVSRIGDDYSPAALHAYFKRWEASVIAECPKDKLLVFEAKQGWEPLCKFLGRPVPSVPYPHINDTAEFKGIVRTINTVGWIWTAMLTTGVAYAAQKLLLLKDAV